MKKVLFSTLVIALALGMAPPITAPVAAQDGIEAVIDIKFISDPNAFNCKKKGVVPVTIFGSDSFDVEDINLESIRLVREDGGTGCHTEEYVEILTSKVPHDRGNPEWAGVSGDNPDVVTCIEYDSDGDPVEVVLNIVGDTDDLNLDGCADRDDRDGYLDLDVGFYAPDVAALICCTDLQRKGGPSVPLLVIGTIDGEEFTSVPTGDDGADLLTRKN